MLYLIVCLTSKVVKANKYLNPDETCHLDGLCMVPFYSAKTFTITFFNRLNESVLWSYFSDSHVSYSLNSLSMVRDILVCVPFPTPPVI